eukprot:CAMPEP_0194076434 /NCGR_PEP_ID=MMETSP0149-20130528/3232_1 /TAXON_ID=122233 /ORGANISM="Chaetoceros debilis, Strain MM31A-1" /LENGTH=516 /DNA_ID=CAMNT_0038757175 /DNA_START=80 /DNA_END=1630 /DNA_ORIENTATION=+
MASAILKRRKHSVRERSKRRKYSVRKRSIYLGLIALAIIFPVLQYVFLCQMTSSGASDSLTIQPQQQQHQTDLFKVEDSNEEKGNVQSNAFLTMYGSHVVADSIAQLPKWLKDYFDWHRDQTINPTSETKYLILACLPTDKQCGGISDRLRPLPFYILFASMVPRVLCIYWLKPSPLEDFLQPPEGGIDWRCPAEVSSLYDMSRDADHQNTIRMIFPNKIGKDNMVETVESRILGLREDESKYISTRLISNDIPSMNEALNLFQRHSYDGKAVTVGKWDFVDLHGPIFRTLFEPVSELAKQVNATMTKLNLVENSYTSVHTRCRYPVYPVAKTEGIKVDKDGGLQFVGKVKTLLIEIMQNSVNCAHMLAPDLPLYFASDHDDATRYMISNDVKVDDGSIVKPIGVDREKEPLHMGSETVDKSTKASDYYSVFEDLLIMGGSRCVSHGIGSFGAFGASLAGNRCRNVHRKFTGRLVECPNDRSTREMQIIEGGLLFGEIPGDDGKLKLETDSSVLVA